MNDIERARVLRKKTPHLKAEYALWRARRMNRIDAIEYRGNWWDGITFERDGYEIHVEVTPDEDPIGYGTFSDAYTPGAVRNPNYYRGARDTYEWYESESGETPESMAKYYHDHEGMTKAAALELATKLLQDEAKMAAENAYYGITVTVTKDGKTGRSETLWGAGLTDKYGLFDVIEGECMVRDAIDELNAHRQVTIGGRTFTVEMPPELTPDEVAVRVWNEFRKSRVVVDGKEFAPPEVQAQ